jgi:hypothetical protein
MNRQDLNVLLVMAHSGAVMSGANHVTTWVSENGDRARVTVHYPLRTPRTPADAYRLLDDMTKSAGGTVPGSVTVMSDGISCEARRGDATAELVVMTGSGMQALAAIPAPRDGAAEDLDDLAHDRDDEIHDARLDHLLHGVEQ